MTGKPELSPSEIGQRVRMIRKRRGLSATVVAGLAGISRPYLTQLETGVRRFERRGLLENLANALGCSVVDLTGRPPIESTNAATLTAIPGISVALYNSTLHDVPDIPVRAVTDLVTWSSTANEQTANSRYSLAGRDLGTLLTELHIHAVNGDPDTRRAALAALVEACFVASGIARNLGNLDLAIHAARRGQEAAQRLGDPALIAFAAMTSTSALSRLGARHRAHQVATTSLVDVEPYADPTAKDTSAAQSAGMLHLATAQMAAKDHRPADADAHLDAARELAERTGEQNRLWFSFGPANVRAWSVSVAVELGLGPAAAEAVESTPDYLDGLVTTDRRAALHFDLARAYAQADGDRDAAALRHLDMADRIAPQRLRPDPIARELIAGLDNRNRRTTWELDSLRHRFGLTRSHG